MPVSLGEEWQATRALSQVLWATAEDQLPAQPK